MKKLDLRLESDKRLQDKHLVFTGHIRFGSHPFSQFLVLKFSSKKNTAFIVSIVFCDNRFQLL